MSYSVRDFIAWRRSTRTDRRSDFVRSARRQPAPVSHDASRPGPRPTLVDVFARHPEWVARAAEPRARATLRLRWPR